MCIFFHLNSWWQSSCWYQSDNHPFHNSAHWSVHPYRRERQRAQTCRPDPWSTCCQPGQEEHPFLCKIILTLLKFILIACLVVCVFVKSLSRSEPFQSLSLLNYLCSENFQTIVSQSSLSLLLFGWKYCSYKFCL